MVTKVLPNVFYGVHTVDPKSLLASLGILTGAAILALAIPAWRATGVDPIRILSRD
jgi:ABC-type antimicrobial peptide transport system permease subunit